MPNNRKGPPFEVQLTDLNTTGTKGLPNLEGFDATNLENPKSIALLDVKLCLSSVENINAEQDLLPISLEGDDFDTAKNKLLDLLDYIDSISCIYHPLQKKLLRQSVEDIIDSLSLNFGSEITLFGHSLYRTNFIPNRAEKNKVEMLYKIFYAIADPANYAEILKDHINLQLTSYPRFSSLFYKLVAPLEYILGIVGAAASLILGAITLVTFAGILPAFLLSMHGVFTWKKSKVAEEKETLNQLNCFFTEHLHDHYNQTKRKLYQTLKLVSFPEINIDSKVETKTTAIADIEMLKKDPSFQALITSMIEDLDRSPLSQQEKAETLNQLTEVLTDPLNKSENFNKHVQNVATKYSGSPATFQFLTSFSLALTVAIAGISFCFLWAGWGALGFIPAAGFAKLAHYSYQREHLASANISLKEIHQHIQDNLPKRRLS